MTERPEILVISGPCGVGKTSTGAALSGLLQDAKVPHTFIDMDALTYTYPRPEHDRFADALALKNLSAIWSNARAAGARYLIVPRVAETKDYAVNMGHALGIDTVHLCRLVASNDDLSHRIRSRSTGAAADWHEKRAWELSDILETLGGEDIKIDTTDKTKDMVAAELFDWLEWTP